MDHEAAIATAGQIADRVLAPGARQNDKDGRFSSEAVAAFGPAGLLGLMLAANEPLAVSNRRAGRHFRENGLGDLEMAVSLASSHFQHVS